MIAECFVDSNILIYTHETGAKSERARECIASLASVDALVISPQVAAEVVVNVARAVDRATARAFGAELLEISHVQPLDAQTTARALEMADRFGLSFWDAQIVAAAHAAGVDYLLSEDLQDGQDIDGLRVLNPLADGFDFGALTLER